MPQAPSLLCYESRVVSVNKSSYQEEFPSMMDTQAFLVIIRPISIYELTILAKKIIKIGPLGPEIWLFLSLGLGVIHLVCTQAGGRGG